MRPIRHLIEKATRTLGPLDKDDPDERQIGEELIVAITAAEAWMKKAQKRCRHILPCKKDANGEWVKDGDVCEICGKDTSNG